MVREEGIEDEGERVLMENRRREKRDKELVIKEAILQQRERAHLGDFRESQRKWLLCKLISFHKLTSMCYCKRNLGETFFSFSFLFGHYLLLLVILNF